MARCTPVSKDFEARQESLEKIGQKFVNNSVVKQFDKGTHTSMFKKLVYQVTDMEYRLPKVEELKLLNRIVDREIKRVGKDRGKFAELLYLPQEIYGDIPFLKKWYKDVQRSSLVLKGNTQEFNNGLNQIINLLKPAASNQGYKESFFEKVGLDSKRLQRELTNKYKKFNKLQQEGKREDAQRYYETEIQDFVTKGEGRVLQLFHELASMPAPEYKLKVREEKYADVVPAVQVWRGESGLGGLQKKGKDILVSGLRTFRNVLNQRKEEYSSKLDNFDAAYKQIDNLVKRFETGELQKDGYFPVLTFDILPTLSKASAKIYNKSDIKQNQEGVDLIAKVGDLLESNIYMNKNMREQGRVDSHIDYNVIPLIHSYGNSVSRFNYSIYNASKFIEAMHKMSDLMQKNNNPQLEKKLNFLKNYMSDTYSIIDGSKFAEKPMMTDVARGITAYEFGSKLGLNIRGAARNATQSLFNWVYFGNKGISEYREALGNADMRLRIEKGLKNNGILFPEIAEVYGSKLTKTEYDAKTGTYREVVDLSMSDNILSRMESIAETLGKPMSWVENRINRRLTFGIAYAKSFNVDANNARLMRKLFENKYIRSNRNNVEKYKELEKDSARYEKEYNEVLEKRAENFANDMTNNIHFDYSMPGKSKILTTPIGSVLGQFQHYGINFFNLQRKIVRDGTDAVFTGQWSNPAAYRMYRLGLMYTVINGMLAPMLNINTGNLIQNDTYERLSSYYKSIDEETRKEQFFGKGPLIGTLGGPFISDAIGLFNVMGLYEMDSDSMLSYLAGYEEMANDTDYSEEILQILNPGARRFIKQTVPSWQAGENLGSMFMGEFSLYPTKQSKERKEAILGFLGIDLDKKKPEPIKTIMDVNIEDVLKSLNKLEQ